jgi:hypothetical protein
MTMAQDDGSDAKPKSNSPGKRNDPRTAKDTGHKPKHEKKEGK